MGGSWLTYCKSGSRRVFARGMSNRKPLVRDFGEGFDSMPRRRVQSAVARKMHGSYFVRLKLPLLSELQKKPFHDSEVFLPRIWVALLLFRAPLKRSGT